MYNTRPNRTVTSSFDTQYNGEWPVPLLRVQRLVACFCGAPPTKARRMQGRKLTDIFGNRIYDSKSSADGTAIALDGYGYRWFRLD
ncbi:hypothetical protein [Bradyrhizobium sp. USDA 336]|uniref:hypothetical protein n=1 Tax=Bradyrhizobium sp. USDA 336 TaxID=3156311 RepID=UPI003835881A